MVSLACIVSYCLVAFVRVLVIYFTSRFGSPRLLQPIHGDLVMLQGVWLRDYEPMNQRQDNQTSERETLGAVKPSNAYKRRVAGTNWQ